MRSIKNIKKNIKLMRIIRTEIYQAPIYYRFMIFRPVILHNFGNLLIIISRKIFENGLKNIKYKFFLNSEYSLLFLSRRKMGLDPLQL